MLLDLTLSGRTILGHQAGGFIGELVGEIGKSLVGTMDRWRLSADTVALISELNPRVKSHGCFPLQTVAYLSQAVFSSGV